MEALIRNCDNCFYYEGNISCYKNTCSAFSQWKSKGVSNGNTKQVPDLLNEKANLFKEKGKVYGHTYKDFGAILTLLFPGGIEINTVGKGNRIGIFFMLVHKLLRLAKTLFSNDSLDSVRDLQVYGAMLEEIILNDDKNE